MLKKLIYLGGGVMDQVCIKCKKLNDSSKIQWIKSINV